MSAARLRSSDQCPMIDDLQIIWNEIKVTEPELTGPFYILYIRLGFNSKIVNNCTNDNELILPTITDKRQTRPLVREGAPHGQDSNIQT
jgi:hypothetical protein